MIKIVMDPWERGMIYVLREVRPRARPPVKGGAQGQLEPYLTSTIEKLLKRRYYEYEK